ncbi:hypothetical protein CRM22_003418 [Opisthorchis felineus]|uniref:Uncharacterized protein n=1 Tax=Opisthorchis felineus TaxID=147828 RepID=A0A4S2M7G3_OPIFE|nr:hypothetical protein CRM22_003418 [Opisthorchis felineus]
MLMSSTSHSSPNINPTVAASVPKKRLNAQSKQLLPSETRDHRQGPPNSSDGHLDPSSVHAYRAAVQHIPSANPPTTTVIYQLGQQHQSSFGYPKVSHYTLVPSPCIYRHTPSGPDST